MLLTVPPAGLALSCFKAPHTAISSFDLHLSQVISTGQGLLSALRNGYLQHKNIRITCTETRMKCLQAHDLDKSV